MVYLTTVLENNILFFRIKNKKTHLTTINCIFFFIFKNKKQNVFRKHVFIVF